MLLTSIPHNPESSGKRLQGHHACCILSVKNAIIVENYTAKNVLTPSEGRIPGLPIEFTLF